MIERSVRKFTFLEVDNNLRVSFFFIKCAAAGDCSVWFPSCPKIAAHSKLQNEGGCGPKNCFFSPDLCILITCSSEKCIRINQEVLQALHFFASRAGKCQLFLREDTFFNLDILRG